MEFKPTERSLKVGKSVAEFSRLDKTRPPFNQAYAAVEVVDKWKGRDPQREVQYMTASEMGRFDDGAIRAYLDYQKRHNIKSDIEYVNKWDEQSDLQETSDEMMRRGGLIDQIDDRLEEYFAEDGPQPDFDREEYDLLKRADKMKNVVNFGLGSIRASLANNLTAIGHKYPSENGALARTRDFWGDMESSKMYAYTEGHEHEGNRNELNVVYSQDMIRAPASLVASVLSHEHAHAHEMFEGLDASTMMSHGKGWYETIGDFNKVLPPGSQRITQVVPRHHNHRELKATRNYFVSPTAEQYKLATNAARSKKAKAT